MVVGKRHRLMGGKHNQPAGLGLTANECIDQFPAGGVKRRVRFVQPQTRGAANRRVSARRRLCPAESVLTRWSACLSKPAKASKSSVRVALAKSKTGFRKNWFRAGSSVFSGHRHGRDNDIVCQWRAVGQRNSAGGRAKRPQIIRRSEVLPAPLAPETCNHTAGKREIQIGKNHPQARTRARFSTRKDT